MLRLALAFALSLSALPASAEAQDPVLGDDGLYKPSWLHETFKDLREDLAEAQADGKRLLVMVEQRGCIYCRKMHEEVFTVPAIDAMLTEDYFVVQINMFGDVEITDFDGTALPEKKAVGRWGVLFTPTLMFFPEDPASIPADATAGEAAVATMPGAFEPDTTEHLLKWILEKGYDGDEPFQKYHARRLWEDGTTE